MKNKKLLYEITLWEFNRWFKLKDQIISVAIIAIISLLIFGGKSLIDSRKNKEINIAVVNHELLPADLKVEKNIILKPVEKSELKNLYRSLSEENIDGILLIESGDSSTLHINKDSEWIAQLRTAFNISHQSRKLHELQLSREQLGELFKEYRINVVNSDESVKKIGTGEKVTAGVFIGIMLVAVFISLAYQLVAITGEKQLRITELVVSAISPQVWIDGKILGISLLSFVSLITYSFSSVMFVVISAVFGSGWSIPIFISNPALVLLLLFISVLGFFFWNIFFTAIAATINDPNTSARGSMMFIPLLPVTLAFFAIGNPNTDFMRFLSIFPLTSPSVLSARLVLTSVPAWEILLAIVLIVISMWYMRILAAKIFSTSILISGKEPGWKEIMKWLKES